MANAIIYGTLVSQRVGGRLSAGDGSFPIPAQWGKLAMPLSANTKTGRSA
jgi:hypothetical protein